MSSSNEGGSVSSAVRHGSLWTPPPVRGNYLQNQQQAHSSGRPGPRNYIFHYHTAPVTSDQRNNQQKSRHVIGTNPPSSSSSSSSSSLPKNNSEHLQSNQTAQLWSNFAQTVHQGGPGFFAVALQNATPQVRAPVQDSRTQIHVSQTAVIQQQGYMNTIYVPSTSSGPRLQHGPSAGNLAQKYQRLNVSSQHSHQTYNKQHNNVQYLQQPVAQSQESPPSHMTRTGNGVSYVTGPQFHASLQGSIARPPPPPPPPPYSTQRNPFIQNHSQHPNVNQTRNSSVIMHAPAPRVSTVIQNQINASVNVGPRSSLPPSPSYTDQRSFLALNPKQQSINQRDQSLYNSQKLVNCGVTVTQAQPHTNTAPVSGHHAKRFPSLPVQQGNVVDSNGQCRKGGSPILQTLLAHNSELLNRPTNNARLHSCPGYANISTSTVPNPPSRPVDFSRGSPAKLLQENSHHTSSQLQYSVDPNECLEVVMALQKRLQQTAKAVAVVPPISQHATDPGVVGTDKDSSIKIDAVWTLATEKANVDAQPKSPDLPVDCAAKLDGDKPGNGFTAHVPNSEVLSPRNIPTSVIKVAESEPERTSPDSAKPPQEPTPSAHLKAKRPVEQRGEENVLSPSGNTTSPTPNIPVKNLTLRELRALIKSLEVTPEANEKQSDVFMSIMDLYWGGNVKNIALKALKQMREEWILDGVFELCVMEKHDVVLQCLEQKDLKVLEKHYHILQNEIVAPVEEFRSSWQNVGEQPPDIGSVLAEPLSDYGVTSPRNASQPQTFHQQGEEGAKDLSAAIHKDATQSVGGKPLVSDKVRETAHVMNSEVLSKTEADPALLIERSKPIPLVEQNLEKSNEQAPLETNTSTPRQSSHVQSVQNDEDLDDRRKKNDVSGDDGSTSDPMLLELPLCDDVEIIFTGSAKSDLHTDFLQFLQGESKTLTVTSSPAQESSGEEIKDSFANNIRFTCPHVTEVVSDLDYFCPKCWDETPLIKLDLDETMWSPESGLSIEIIADEVERETQSGKLQDEKVCEDATQPVEINSTDDESVITLSPNPGDESLSSSSLFGELPVLEPAVPVCNKDGSAAQSDITSPTMDPPVLEPICLEAVREKTEISSSTSTAFPKSLSDKGDTEKATGIPTSSMQNALSTTTSKMETAPADNALSSCSETKKSTNEQKHCRDGVKDGHGKDLKHFPNMNTFLKSVQKKLDTYGMDKKPSVSPLLDKSVQGTKQGGQEVRLVLYGTPRSNSDERVWHIRRDEKRTFSAPTCIAVSSRADDWKSAAWNPGDQKEKSSTAPVGATTNSPVDKHHSDQQSARMKVYKQWSSSFVYSKPHTSSSHKMLKGKVMSKMDKMTKIKLQFKESKLKSFQETLTAGHKRKREESFSKSREKKRLKRASCCV